MNGVKRRRTTQRIPYRSGINLKSRSIILTFYFFVVLLACASNVEGEPTTDPQSEPQTPKTTAQDTNQTNNNGNQTNDIFSNELFPLADNPGSWAHFGNSMVLPVCNWTRPVTPARPYDIGSELLTQLLGHLHRALSAVGLRWWVEHGTLLGVYRHRGTIPFTDNDADAGVEARHFKRVVEALKAYAYSLPGRPLGVFMPAPQLKIVKIYYVAVSKGCQKRYGKVFQDVILPAEPWQLDILGQSYTPDLCWEMFNQLPVPCMTNADSYLQSKYGPDFMTPYVCGEIPQLCATHPSIEGLKFVNKTAAPKRQGTPTGILNSDPIQWRPQHMFGPPTNLVWRSEWDQGAPIDLTTMSRAGIFPWVVHGQWETLCSGESPSQYWCRAKNSTIAPCNEIPQGDRRKVGKKKKR